MEIEGSVGHIDVDKYRQLLDHVENEAESGIEVKGILVGNGYRLLPPGERENQFTEAGVNGATRQGYCLMTTVELFNTLKSILENPSSEELTSRIRQRILAKVGLFEYTEN